MRSKERLATLGLALCAALACGPQTPESKYRSALSHFDVSKLQAELDAGRDPNFRFEGGDRPLHVLAGSSSAKGDRARLLIERGADVDAKNDAGKTAWDVLWDDRGRLSQGETEVAAALLDAGYTPALDGYADGRSLLHEVAERVPSTLVVKILVADRGLAVDTRDAFGWTPLHTAALHRNVEAATGLLERDADVNAETTKVREELETRGESKYTRWRYEAKSRPLDVARYTVGRGKSVHDVLREYGGTENPDVNNVPMR